MGKIRPQDISFKTFLNLVYEICFNVKKFRLIRKIINEFDHALPISPNFLLNIINDKFMDMLLIKYIIATFLFLPKPTNICLPGCPNVIKQ